MAAGVGAALAAKAVGKPVKMVLDREADSKFDSVRSPSVQKLKMGFDKDNNPIAMEHHVAAGWPTEVMAPFFMPKGEKDVPYDPFAINGANHWYSVGAHKVRAVSNDLASQTFRPGWLRSVGPGCTSLGHTPAWPAHKLTNWLTYAAILASSMPGPPLGFVLPEAVTIPRLKTKTISGSKAATPVVGWQTYAHENSLR